MRHTPDMETTVRGIPCGVVVSYYSPPRPMAITGWGFGDAEPPEPEEIEWFLIDRKGYRADWLEAKMSERDRGEITSELSEARKRR